MSEFCVKKEGYSLLFLKKIMLCKCASILFQKVKLKSYVFTENYAIKIESVIGEVKERHIYQQKKNVLQN